jgi:hypothetical protein
MIDCALPYNGWNNFWCYILLFIDIKEIVTDYLHLKNFLLGPTCAMIIIFLLVNMITSQETSTKFLCRTLMSTLQYSIGEFLYFNLKYNVITNSILSTFGKLLVLGIITIINREQRTLFETLLLLQRSDITDIFVLSLNNILHSVHITSNMFSGVCYSSCELFVEISRDCFVV